MIIHTVEYGDSIYAIAKKYGVPPSRIILDNELDNPSKLIVGQDLVILFPTTTYTVRGGDTIDSIAARFGIDRNQIWRNNPSLGGKSIIYPGQTLNIAYPEPEYGNIATNGYVYPFVNREVLQKTLPYLSYLSIFTYGIKEDGTLIPPPGGNDSEIISIAREYGTVPLMMLTSLTENGNFSNELVNKLLSSTELQNQIIDSVIATVQNKNYGGIDIDFEYISSQYADAYAAFVNNMRMKMEALGYVTFASLAPKTSASQRGLLYEGHSYREIGKAANKVLLMTYEWGYSFGPPMAVSPINSVRQVLDYAVTEIPPEKIFMGFSNYGYDWALPYVKGESKAESLSNVEAIKLAQDKNAQILFDETASAPYFYYYERHTSEQNAVKHIVWFENAKSSQARLKLIPEYGLYGVGVWNVMKYFPSLWLVLNSMFKIDRPGV